MAETKWLSLLALAKQAGVPESTTRRYTVKFAAYLRFEERQRGRRFHPECVAVIARIQSLYADGMETEEIERILQREYPINVDLAESTPPPPPSFATRADVDLLFEQLDTMMGEVKATREEMAAIRAENERLRKLAESREERDKERDQRITEAMNVMLEVRREIAAAREEKQQKKSWWQFWK